MINRIDTVNGKEVTEFKKNTDYFEMSDGVFWTIEALMKKYDIARSTLYNKARDNHIREMKILGIQCFKDDVRFAKQKNGAGNIENLQGKGLMSYAELHRKVEELLNSIRAQTLPSGIDGLASEVRKVNDGYMVNMDRLNKTITRLNDSVVENNRLLNEVLNYLTTNEMEKEVKKDG
jgi:hypothetical protein